MPPPKNVPQKLVLCKTYFWEGQGRNPARSELSLLSPPAGHSFALGKPLQGYTGFGRGEAILIYVDRR